MATKDRPSSTGSIKRSNTKISADGLTVLPPEPGLVKFESLGITRPTSNTDSSKTTSALGRVKRSLHLAKKKEQEDDILIPESSAGIHLTDNAGVSDHSLVPAIANLQLTKQDDRKDSQHTIDSESSETDSCYGDDRSYEASSSKREISEDAVTEDQSKAPVELKGEFLKAVMDEEFEKAKELCQKILLLEPDNKTCSEFHAVICEKMKQDDENDGNGDSDPGDDETEESDESVDDDEENDDDDDDDDDNDDDDDEGSESSEEISSDDSDDDVTLPSGSVNLIMGGLPIIPQKR